MLYNLNTKTEKCTVCESAAIIHNRQYNVGEVVVCSSRGHLSISDVVADDVGLPLKKPKTRGWAASLLSGTL
jgi:hypothetical protein